VLGVDFERNEAEKTISRDLVSCRLSLFPAEKTNSFLTQIFADELPSGANSRRDEKSSRLRHVRLE
jgi:hypothetical protein